MSEKTSEFYQDAEPTPRRVGDLWITSAGVVKVAYRVQPEGTPLWVNPSAYDITLQSLTSGRIFVGNGSNLAAAVAVSGDAALSNAGAVTVSVMSKTVVNKSGSDITTDKLVALAGLDATATVPKIVLADADVAAHEDVWVTTATIANNATGVVKKQATSAANLNTDAASAAGDPVYLDTTAGGFTVTAPSGSDDRVHPVGFVLVKHAATGQILWHIGPVRKFATNEFQTDSVTNDVLANIARGSIKVGGASNAPTDLDAKTSGRILVGDGTDLVSVAVSGDATLSAAGAVSLAAQVVNGSEIANTANINVIGGVPVLHRITATTLTGDVDVTLTHKTRVIDVWCVATAAGGAADTITVKNGANAITDAIDMNVSDAVVKRAGTIDDAQWDIAASGTLRITGASAVNAEVFVLGLRVA